MHSFLIILFLATLFGNVLCGFLNISIDDTSGDSTTGAHIMYGPTNAWASSSSPCPPLDIQSDKAFNKTWHSGVYTKYVDPVWASVSFAGNAVYVWGILAPCSSPNIGDATIGFTIDGQQMGKFRQPSSNKPDAFQYNVLLFSAVGLNNSNHTLVMGIGGGNQTAYAILDRITYTTTVEIKPPASVHQPATTTTPKPSSAGSPSAKSTTTQAPSMSSINDQTATSSTTAAGSSGSSADASQGAASSPSSQVVTGTIVGGLIGGCAALAAVFLLARWIWAVRQRRALSDLEDRYQYVDRDNLDCKSVEMREETKSRDPSVLNISRMRDSILRSSKKLFPVMLLPSRDSFPTSQR